MGKIRGKSIFADIVIGRPYIQHKKEIDIENYKIENEEIPKEIEIFFEAVKEAKEDINNLKNNLQGKVNKEDLKILIVHIMMLDDPQFIKDIKENIKKGNKAEAAVKKIANRYIEMFEKIEDPIYKQRALDIKDISERILNNLVNQEINYSSLNNKILVIKELLPSELLKIYYNGIKLKGIIMEFMGETSHTAILVKALEIPTIMGSHDLFSLDWGDRIILDTTKIEGEIISNPTEEVLNEYLEIQAKYKGKLKNIEETKDKETITIDGERVYLHLNMGGRLDMTKVSEKRPDGIGLLRTELIYMDAPYFPTEETQRKIYANIAKEFGDDKPIIIRTLDIGADKQLSYYEMLEEENPSLGCRGIRFTLRNKERFKEQLKGILTAAIDTEIKLMHPMITNIQELKEATEILEECKKELDEEQKKYKKDIEVGMMIEVPSAILLADIFSKYVDFFSIGTNDLTQYILATDRFSSVSESLYDSYDPAVLRGIYKVAKVGERNSKKVSVCGEMAGEELAAIALLSLGIRDLSMAPPYIPRIRNLIRRIKVSELEEIKNKILLSEDSKEIKKILGEYLEKIEERN